MIAFKYISMIICMISIVLMPITLFINFQLCAVIMIIFIVSWACTQIAKTIIKEKIINNTYKEIE